MMNILLSGCSGKMGQVVTRLAGAMDDITIKAGFDLRAVPGTGYPVYDDLSKCAGDFDAIIDFSNPDVIDNLLLFAIKHRIPSVIATTGLSVAHKKLMKNASDVIPVFYSANMSLGINLLISLAKKAAHLLQDNFDIEIIEKHHNQKLDSPSGTALAIADAVNGALDERYEYIYDRHSRRKKRANNEIGISSIRGGTIVGDHSVIFAGCDEILELSHSAMSRDIFAHGALKAALFIKGLRPGLYSMDDLLAAN